MLLHKVEAAGEVDPAGDGGPVRQRRGKAVKDHAVLTLGDLDDGDCVERAGVEELAAGGGVERGPVEFDLEAVLGRRHYYGIKLAQVGVCVIQP